MDRPHIDSVEFELFLNEFDPEFLRENDENTLYDLWVRGYSSWEIGEILG